MKTRFQMVFEEDLRKNLEKLAIQEDRSMNAVIRVALRKYIEEGQKEHDTTTI